MFKKPSNLTPPAPQTPNNGYKSPMRERDSPFAPRGQDLGFIARQEVVFDGFKWFFSSNYAVFNIRMELAARLL
jgi:hypothetical protein